MSYVPNGVHYYPFVEEDAHAWQTIFECKACGSRGDIVMMNGTHDPCPTCAREDKHEVTGRWIWGWLPRTWKTLWLTRERTGYWQLRTEFFS